MKFSTLIVITGAACFSNGLAAMSLVDNHHGAKAICFFFCGMLSIFQLWIYGIRLERKLRRAEEDIFHARKALDDSRR